MELIQTIGTRLKEARDKRGWSQRELAVMSGSSNASISRWEANQREMTAGNIISVCYALDISPNWLLTGNEQFNSPNSTATLKTCFEVIGRYADLEKRVKSLEKLYLVKGNKNETDN